MRNPVIRQMRTNEYDQVGYFEVMREFCYTSQLFCFQSESLHVRRGCMGAVLPRRGSEHHAVPREGIHHV